MTLPQQGHVPLETVRRFLGLSRNTVLRLCADPGEHFPKSMRICNRRLFSTEEVRRWVDRRKERAS
jgi:predicted DNA-binding transcriptional regulator AlpA